MIIEAKEGDQFSWDVKVTLSKFFWIRRPSKQRLVFLSPECVVIFTGISAEIIAEKLVPLLDGTRTAGQILQHLSGSLPPGLIAKLLRELSYRGLMTEQDGPQKMAASALGVLANLPDPGLKDRALLLTNSSTGVVQ